MASMDDILFFIFCLSLVTMITLEQAGFLLLASLLWGGTNPFMKRGSSGISTVKKFDNPIGQILYEFWFLFTRWQYVIPYLVNISGSVLFYYSLASMELSLVVPVVNSLTFIFTQIVSMILGEETGNIRTFAGIGFVVFGVAICVWSGLQ